MSFRNATQQQEAIEAARVERAKKETVEAVFFKYPTLVQCEANARKIIEDISFWAQNTEILPTFQLFQSMLDENPDHIKTYATQSVERGRQQVIDDILNLLASKNGGRDGKFDSYNLRSEKARMQSWNLPALRTRLNEIKVKQKMSAAPVSVLKSFVADAHREDRPFPGWPTLPKSMWSSSQGRTINIDADYLNFIGKHDRYEFARVCKLYGTSQVDARRGIR